MSIRFETVDESFEDSSAKTEYGKHLEATTAKLSSISVASNVPLTHVVRSNPLHTPNSTGSVVASALRDARSRTVHIDFGSPLEVNVRERRSRIASIFDAQFRAEPPKGSSTGSRTSYKPVTNQLQTSYEPVTFSARWPSQPELPRGQYTRPNDYQPEDARDDPQTTPRKSIRRPVNEQVLAWWYTKDLTESVQLMKTEYDEGPVTVQSVIWPPLIDVYSSWNWFSNATYQYGMDNYNDELTVDTIEQIRTHAPEDVVHMPIFDKDLGTSQMQAVFRVSKEHRKTGENVFVGMRKIMTEYLSKEWELYCTAYDGGFQDKDLDNQRFHVLFETWFWLLQSDLNSLDTVEASYVQMAASAESRIEDIVDWIATYFLNASREDSPVLQACRAYQKDDLMFWIDYAPDAILDNISPPLDSRNSTSDQARYATWSSILNQSSKWDEPSARESITFDPTTTPSPSPGTLHEFLFGVVLNRWLPWVLNTIRPYPTKKAGEARKPQRIAEVEEECFRKWAADFMDVARTKAHWRLTPDLMQQSMRNRFGPLVKDPPNGNDPDSQNEGPMEEVEFE